jgi:hypothetical protein
VVWSLSRLGLGVEYKSGKSAVDVARQYGTHRRTVVNHLRRDGVAVRGGQVEMTPETIAQAAHLYISGLSLATVGAYLGVDATTVHRVLEKAGVTMRNSHGRPG